MKPTERAPSASGHDARETSVPPIAIRDAEQLLNAMPTPALVVDAALRIVSTNEHFRTLLGVNHAESLVGMCPGAALTCVHAAAAPEGCSPESCRTRCGLLAAPHASHATRTATVNEATIQTRQAGNGGALEYRVHATPVRMEDTDCVVIGLEDLQHERRRRALERALFREIRSLTDTIATEARRLRDLPPGREQAADGLGVLERLSQRLADAVDTQHVLHLADAGDLEAEPERVPLAGFLRDLLAFHREHSCPEGREIRCASLPAGHFDTNPRTLRRALNPLIVNALEATPPGGVVRLACTLDEDGVRFVVHNAGVIPDDAREKLFTRSFTTKREEGRGLGLHHAFTLAQFYLNGRISFTSDEAQGTRFELRLFR